MSDIIELENGFRRKQSRVSKFITEARSNLNLNELKAFYQLTTLINMEDKDFNNYEISIREFADTLELQNKDRAYIKKICKNLLEQNFILDYTHENNDWDLVKISIFKQFSYKHKEQKLLISFSEDIKPYLLELKERFTKIENVEYIKQFESKYAIRIYALLKDYRKMAYRDMEIEALHKILQTPKSYKNYKNFWDNVLTPAVKEINEKSDLFISRIEEIKKERKKVLRIRIHFGLQSKKVADDTLNYLIDYYKQTKNIRCFIGSRFMMKEWNELGVITDIDVEQEGDRVIYSLYCNNSDIKTLMYVNEKMDFLNEVCKGIHRAIEYYCDNLKKTTLNLELWQDKQEQIKYYKNVVKFWVDTFKQK